MSFKTEDITVSGSGKYDGVYTMKEISWGTDNELTNRCTDRVLGEKPIIRFNFAQYNRLLFAKSLVKWPLQDDITEENINNLPKKIGEMLFGIVRKLNTVTDVDRRDFLQTSEAGNIQTKQPESS